MENKKPPAPSTMARNVSAKSANPFAQKRPGALPSPFAKTASVEVDAETLSDDAAYYKLNAQQAGTLAAADVDSAARAVEVQVLWGEYDAIHLSLLSPPRAFVIAEEDADFVMETAQLGVARYPLTMVESGETYVLIPFGAEVSVRNGEVERKLTALREEGALSGCALEGAADGAMRYRLVDGDVVRVRRAGFVFQVKSVAAAKRTKAAGRFDFVPAFYVGGAATVIGALMMALALANPGGGMLASGDVDTSSRLVQSLINPPETPDLPQSASNSTSSQSADSGQRASGEEGQSGRPNRPVTGRRRTDAGQSSTTAATSSSDAVQRSEILGTIQTFAGGLVTSSSPYSASAARDPMTQAGAMLGIVPGESGGMGGLGMIGHGLGGGNPLNDVLFSGGFETMSDRPGGPGGPGGPGQRPGRGFRDGNDLGQREGAVPSQAIPGPAVVAGSLPQDVIRRVVQRNLGQVRFCYEQALNARPDLAGRVVVRFFISPSGAVSTAAVTSSSLGDTRVEGCIAGAMRRLSFPAPDGGGMVSVTYPFTLSSGH